MKHPAAVSGDIVFRDEHLRYEALGPCAIPKFAAIQKHWAKDPYAALSRQLSRSRLTRALDRSRTIARLEAGVCDVSHHVAVQGRSWPLAAAPTLRLRVRFRG